MWASGRSSRPSSVSSRRSLPISPTTSVWHPSPAWTGTRGTPAEAVQQALRSATEPPDIYVCGPPPMIDAVSDAAVEGGVDAEHVFSERYLPT